MSKFEANEFVDDRYTKMAERLEVRRNHDKQPCSAILPLIRTDHTFPLRYSHLHIPLQVVKKRLDRPLTLAEKVRSTHQFASETLFRSPGRHTDQGPHFSRLYIPIWMNRLLKKSNEALPTSNSGQVRLPSLAANSTIYRTLTSHTHSISRSKLTSILSCRPRGNARRHGSDGYVAVHLIWPPQGCSAFHHSLRPSH